MPSKKSTNVVARKSSKTPNTPIVEDFTENTKERRVKQISQLDHVKMKSMWVGSKDIQTTELYIIANNSENEKIFVLSKIKFAPAWYKIVDEIVVNAIDQYVNYPRKVTRIDIKFIKKTGVIHIRNNGPSIGIYKTKNLQGVDMYVIQLIASEFLSGDNLDDDSERITGGTNGAGLKLTNAFSDYLVISSVDTKVKKYYRQSYRERLTIIDDPEIRKTNSDENESFTEIEFLPCYSVFGYKNGYKEEMFDELEKLMISRAYQAAAFTKIDIYYNDEKIKIPLAPGCDKKSNIFYNFSYMFLPFPDSGLYITNIISSEATMKKFPWTICVGVSDGKFRQVSLVNGIYVYGGGSHIKHLQNQIIDNLNKHMNNILLEQKKYIRQLKMALLLDKPFKDVDVAVTIIIGSIKSIIEYNKKLQGEFNNFNNSASLSIHFENTYVPVIRVSKEYQVSKCKLYLNVFRLNS